MVQGRLGAGEWLLVGYVGVPLGACLCGYLDAGRWFEMILMFGLAFAMALTLGRLVSFVDTSRRVRHEDA